MVAVANEVKRDDGVKVTLRFEGGGVRAFQVPGHDSRLGQVVDNLIENARSFSPPGGTVRVTCRRAKSNVEIFVDDDGPGVRPDAFEKIFERFYTDRPHQGFGQNSGLGLSISKQIVEAHGGAIWVENRIGAPDADGDADRCSARASSCACRRCDGGDRSDRARLGRAGRRARGADPRTVGRRQVAARARTDRSGAHRFFAVRAGWSATTASILKPPAAGCWCGRPRRLPA